MLERLEHEVSFCSKDVKGILSSELKPKKKQQEQDKGASEASEPPDLERPSELRSLSADDIALVGSGEVPMDIAGEGLNATLTAQDLPQPMEEGTGGVAEAGPIVQAGEEGCCRMCMPERAALIKSILNFLKKAIPEPTLAENIRTREADSLVTGNC